MPCKQYHAQTRKINDPGAPARLMRPSRVVFQARVVGHVDNQAMLWRVLRIAGHELFLIAGQEEIEWIARMEVYDLKVRLRHVPGEILL
jgi:hypothetical protein